MSHFLSMPIYLLFLLFLVEYMRKHEKVAHYIWIISLFTFPLWIAGGVVGWFRWMKILSVIIPTIFVGFCRIAYKDDKQSKFALALRKSWPLFIIYGVLFLNIMEATVKDLSLGNYFNAFCGLLLCITIPLPRKHWEFRKDTGDLITYTDAGWNIMYTTWNACFVFGESPMYFASSLCILLAAELYPVIKKRPELYIMARVYTLAAHLIIRACFVDLFPSVMNSSSWANTSVLAIWGIINVVLMTIYTFVRFKKFKKIA